MLPAALAASCGFMLPIATGPNAIAFGTGWVDARTMMREGFVLDLLGVVVMTLVCWATLG
jgi:sodium-dependent dicarboxylate transporter 2/3/5